MEGDRNRVASAEVDDVAVFEEPLVDLLVVDVRPVRRIPVDQQHFAVDRDHFCMPPGDLRVLNYALTHRRSAPDADAEPAEREPLAGAWSLEDGHHTHHSVLARWRTG